MIKRLFGPADSAKAPDPLGSVERLLRLARPTERNEEVLKTLSTTLTGDVRGYVVKGDDEAGYAFDAQSGYGPSLLDLEPGHGPWRSPGPRVVANHIPEMFTPNDQALRAQYADLGLRDASTTLVVPVTGRFVGYGALVLHRHGGHAFTEDELKVAFRWGSVLGEAQSLDTELRRAKLSLVEFTRAFTHIQHYRFRPHLPGSTSVECYAEGLVSGEHRLTLNELEAIRLINAASTAFPKHRYDVPRPLPYNRHINRHIADLHSIVM